MRQTELQLSSRTELLERQHSLLIEKTEIRNSITSIQADIKHWKEQLKATEKELEELTIKLESNQMTLGVK